MSFSLRRPKVVFNNLSLPLGVNLASTGELWFLGEIFTPSFTLIHGGHSLLFGKMQGKHRIFTHREQLHP
jgi:hypothetical protein